MVVVGCPAGCLDMIVFLGKKSFETISGSGELGGRDFVISIEYGLELLRKIIEIPNTVELNR